MINNRVVFIKAILLLICSMGSLLAQDFSQYNWYFGNSSQAIIFQKSDNTPVLNSNQFTPFGVGGSAVASDPITGKLLFYSDGNQIYDASHTAIPGGPINGNNDKNQPIVLCPNPVNSNLYYVFTNDANYALAQPGTITFSEINMTLSGNPPQVGQPALGDYTGPVNQPTGIAGVASEAMIMIPSSDFTKYWLVFHQMNTSTYGVLEVNNLGLGAISNFDLSGLGVPSLAAASFTYNETTNKIAVAPQESNKNIQILNFNPANGTLTFDRLIFNSGFSDGANESIYDAEWSADGSKLYISRYGNGGVGNVYQYDYNNPMQTITSVLPAPITESYGLQIAPDGNIYHLYQQGGQTYVGAISNTDSALSQVIYTSALFNNTNFNGKQFPAFATHEASPLNISFTTINNCENNFTQFIPTISPAPDSILWDLGDGNVSTEIAPLHQYAAAGSYSVQLTAFVNGQAQQFGPQAVNISPFDLQINLVRDTVVCELPFDLTATTQGGQGGVTYTWSNGDVGLTTTITESGNYWLVADDGNCSTYAPVRVELYGEELQKANIWYFGTAAGIDFNEQPPVSLNDGGQNAPEGVAAISDGNGDILFYTDGNTVYNKIHATMSGGTNLGGGVNATQSALIVPFPTDATLFYVFTTDEIWGGNFEFSYAIVDMKADGGNGAVISKDNVLYSNSTERITAYDRGDSTTVVLTHEFGNNTFRAYMVSPQGISAPVIFSIGSTHNYEDSKNGEGYMKISPNGEMIAVTLRGKDGVDLVQLDSMGNATDFVFLDLSADVGAGEVYGVEFSPDNSKLYVAIYDNGGNSKLFQYEVDGPLSGIGATKNQITGLTNGAFGALQISPNQDIYMAVEGSNVIRVINNPNEPAADITVSDFNLSTTSQLGLPNFVQSIFNQLGEAGHTIIPACEGHFTLFSAVGKSSIDQFQWTVRIQGTQQVVFSSNEQNASFIFDTPGDYTADIIISNECEGTHYSVSEDFTIIASPTLNLPLSQALCGGTTTLQANLPGMTEYLWEWNGGQALGADLVVSEPNIYVLTVTSPSGCTSTDSIVVVDGRPVVDLGPDITVCQNEVLSDLDAGNPGLQFSWQINFVPNGNTTRLQPIDTSVPGIYTYEVTVTDPQSTCSRLNTVVITVNAGPDPMGTTMPTSGCGASDGTLSVGNIQPNHTYEWTDLFYVPVMDPNNVPAGNYLLIATNDISGCSDTTAHVVNDPGAHSIDNVNQTPVCGGADIEVQTSGFVNPNQYRLINTDNNTEYIVESGPATHTINSVPEGNYLLEVTGNNGVGCVASQALTVLPADSVEFQLTNTFVDECEPTTQLSIDIGTLNINSADAVYLWTQLSGNPGGIVGVASGSTVTVDESGTYQLQVTDNSATIPCPGTQTIDVNFLETPNVKIEASPDNCTGVRTLTATPANLSYQWSTGDVGNILVIDSQMVADNNGNFSITSQSICNVTEDIDIIINPPFDIAITSQTQACEGDSTVLNVTVTGGQINNHTWYVNGNAIPQTRADILLIEPNEPDGWYKLKAVSSGGCIASDSMFVQRISIPDGQLPDTTYTICPGDSDPLINSVDIEASAGFETYSWTLINENGSAVVSDQQSITANEAGLYVVTMSSLGCSKQDTIEVYQDCTPSIFAPNALKPGGLTKSFSIFTRYVAEEDFSIIIFNRWGEAIYQSNDRDFKWDGTAGGKLVPPGTYAYVINYKAAFEPELGKLQKRGGIVVIR